MLGRALGGDPFRHAAFDEHLDGIVYAAASSLGFALLENAQYALRAAPDAALSLLLVRGLTAVPAHAIAGGLLGYFVGLARFARGGRRVAVLAAALLAGVAFHGAYDWVALSGDELQILELFLVLVLGSGLVALACRSALRQGGEHLRVRSTPRGAPLDRGKERFVVRGPQCPQATSPRVKAGQLSALPRSRRTLYPPAHA